VRDFLPNCIILRVMLLLSINECIDYCWYFHVFFNSLFDMFFETLVLIRSCYLTCFLKPMNSILETSNLGFGVHSFTRIKHIVFPNGLIHLLLDIRVKSKVFLWKIGLVPRLSSYTYYLTSELKVRFFKCICPYTHNLQFSVITNREGVQMKLLGVMDLASQIYTCEKITSFSDYRPPCRYLERDF
jgi:hypothetical protein